ncbi:uncharacterized protein LY79DRAFT_592781 [Colletotrichum navitas]|uniref:Uncharacterized protein n=1 Tax=Colletotrichum navitas TaxID=681940 RepID=A0AAD8PRX6_9PEZI|nr:uncharacterized protein LY79DRAFT_592781 [Colletotrichum navitas]KAK1579618.1 hypothetical protein LY79DRAFT_592781 [Colletotrichum navitas]
MHLREARALYLGCLTFLVLLFGVLGYHVWLHSDTDDSSLLRSATDTLTDHGAKSSVTNKPDLSRLKYAFIMPTYTADIPLAIKFLQSFVCLCNDYREVNIYVIVSDSSEHDLFLSALDGLMPCRERFSIFPVPPGNVGKPRPNIKIINLYDILPPIIHTTTSGSMSPNDTSALLKERGKYQYQTIKKLAAAATLDYDWALWIDSESIAVQPFSIRQTFDTYIQAPTIWRSTMANTDMMRGIMQSSADVLRLLTDSFGHNLWNLESQQWFVEKTIIHDLIQHVEAMHGQEFWSVWAANGGPWEINLYNMHVLSRKLETTNPLFTKFRIIDVEMEMKKYGVCK